MQAQKLTLGRKIVPLLGLSLVIAAGIIWLLFVHYLNRECWNTLWSQRIGEYAIDYPTGWSFDVFSDGSHGDQELVALFYKRLPYPVIAVRRKSFVNPSVQEVASRGEQRIREMTSGDERYELFPLTMVTLGENRVITRVYETDIGTPLPLRKKDACIAREDDGFILTLVATQEGFSGVEPIFDQMVSTFRTTDSADDE